MSLNSTNVINRHAIYQTSYDKSIDAAPLSLLVEGGGGIFIAVLKEINVTRCNIPILIYLNR